MSVNGGGEGGRGAGPSARGRGRGAGGGGPRGGRRKDFGGKLTAEGNKERSGHGKEREREREGAEKKQASSEKGKEKDASGAEEPQVKKLTTAAAPDAELCFICAEPVQLYSVPSCNHRTCHICAIRLRALYKKNECTFCKAPIETCIFTKNPTKDYLAFTAQETPYRDERLSILFETSEAKEEALILLRFNCPDAMCEFVGSSWNDLKAHTRSEHGRFFCDLCLRHKRIFAHEHTLYSASELTAHKRAEHPHCDFCRRFFYSDDEIYVHMRDDHEQCHICKKRDPSGFEYHRDYPALERHFRDAHFLCEFNTCLEKKFVVFESEMDYKAHQVNEHGTELSSREKRDALRVAANFTYDSASSGAAQREQASRRGGPSRRRGAAAAADEEPAAATRGTTDRDVLGISSLASRTHVPGAGPADHATRRAIFRAGLTDDAPQETPRQRQEQLDEQVVARHQAYMGRVSAIMGNSDSRMTSFRGSVKMFRGGEMSALDLIDSIHSLVGQDVDSMSPVVNGLVDLLEDEDKKTAVRQAWSTLRVERTQFPSLVAAPGDGYSGAARGQIRNVKSNAASNNAVWASVERAASGRPVAPRAATSSASRLASSQHFPTLGGAGGGRAVPGSAPYAASANAQQQHAASRGTTPWSISVANAAPHSNAASNSRPIPTSTPALSSGGGTGARNTPTRSNPAAFPSLPTNAQAAALAAHKRQVLSKSKGRSATSGSTTPMNEGSGTSTPNVWGSSGLGRIDGGGGGLAQDDGDLHQVSERLGDVALSQQAADLGGSNSSASKRRKPQKQVLVSMGGVHRG